MCLSTTLVKTVNLDPGPAEDEVVELNVLSGFAINSIWVFLRVIPGVGVVCGRPLSYRGYI